MYLSTVKRITILIISLFWFTNISAQEHCLSNPLHISTELFPNHFGELNAQDYLIIYSDSLEFDGLKYKIQDFTSSPFENKDDLLRIFACKYDFFNASENISGELIDYQIEENIPRIGHDFQFVQFNDCGQIEYYIYVDDGLYRFLNIPNFIEANVSNLEISNEEEIMVEYAHNPDTSAVVYFIEEPEFETVTEQVLVKEAYNVLEVLPNEHIEVLALFYNENSTCENAVFDTIYEQVLMREGGVSFEIVPAQFEVLSELVLAQNEYNGHGFYERPRQDSFVISLRSSYVELNGYNVDAGCDKFDFFECINFDFQLIPSMDSVVYDVFEKCADGFISAGKYCYSNSGVVPWIFEEREYERLAVPATAIQTAIPDEYKTIALIRIANKNELESDCIEIKYDSIPYHKILTPASITSTLIPAVYGTRQYKLYQNGGVIGVESGEEDTYFEVSTIHGGSVELKEFTSNIIFNDSACNFDAIKLRLIEVGYLDESDFDNLQAVHLAALTFQIDNDLPLGVFNDVFMNILDVKFGF